MALRPSCTFPNPMDVRGETYKWAPCGTPCGNSQPGHWSAPSLEKTSAPTPLAPFLGSKRSPPKQV